MPVKQIFPVNFCQSYIYCLYTFVQAHEMSGRQYVSKGVCRCSHCRVSTAWPGCPIPDVDYLCLLCIDFYVWDAVSIFKHLPRMFLSTDFAFRITDWTCCHGPHLHAILRIISRGVSGLATDSPCGVWGRGWNTCLLHDSPLFGSHFKIRVGM